MPKKSVGKVTTPKTRSKGNGEGSVFKRIKNGKTVWYAELVIGWTDEGKKNVIRSPGCEKREQAATWLTERLGERAKGMLVEPSKETVGGFMEEWLENTAPLEVGPSTVRLYTNLHQWYIRPNMGAVLLQQLKPQHIQATFQKIISAGKSPRTAQLVRVVLGRALRQALEWGKIPRNPVDLVKAPRQEHREMQVLEPHQIVQFIDAAKTERLHALFIVAVLTGLRKGELLALRWQDVNMAAGTLTVSQTMKVELVKDKEGKAHERWTFGQVKTKASRRTINLPAAVHATLKRWRKEQEWERNALGEAWPGSDLVFTSETGTPVHPRNLNDRGFSRVLKHAGLPKIRFHDLRHSFATLMVDQGTSDLVLQKVMGHSTINITKGIYGHVLERQKEEAARKVDAFLAAHEKKAH